MQRAHLNGPQNVPEHGALLAFIHLGAVLVAVGRQRAQLVTQDLAVLKLKLLGAVQREGGRLTLANTCNKCTAYFIYF